MSDELLRPYGRDDCELVRGRGDGVYWQASDGLVIRMAAAESQVDAEAVQRALLALACRDANDQ